MQATGLGQTWGQELRIRSFAWMQIQCIFDEIVCWRGLAIDMTASDTAIVCPPPGGEHATCCAGKGLRIGLDVSGQLI